MDKFLLIDKRCCSSLKKISGPECCYSFHQRVADIYIFHNYFIWFSFYSIKKAARPQHAKYFYFFSSSLSLSPFDIYTSDHSLNAMVHWEESQLKHFSRNKISVRGIINFNILFSSFAFSLVILSAILLRLTLTHARLLSCIFKTESVINLDDKGYMNTSFFKTFLFEFRMCVTLWKWLRNILMNYLCDT